MKQKSSIKPVTNKVQKNIPQVKDCTVVIEDVLKLKQDRKDFLVRPCKVILNDIFQNNNVPNSAIFSSLGLQYFNLL